MRAANRKQALVPAGATVLEPVGTAPGLVVAAGVGLRADRASCCPGRRASCSRCGTTALETDALQAALARRGDLRAADPAPVRASPSPRSPRTLRAIEADGRRRSTTLEITTCLRRGEIEIATRYEPGAEADYDAFEAAMRARHGDTLFSRDGSTIDEQVAALLLRPPLRTIGVAESCTGGLMAGRLTDRAGSSAYVLGGAGRLLQRGQVRRSRASPPS